MKTGKVILQPICLMKVKRNKSHYYLVKKQKRPKLIIDLLNEKIGNEKIIVYENLEEYKKFSLPYNDFPMGEFVGKNNELYTTAFRTYTLPYRKKLLDRLLQLQEITKMKLIHDEEIKLIKKYGRIVKKKINEKKSEIDCNK